jgi:hypothetical protein
MLRMGGKSDCGLINALWDADRKGYGRPLREAIKAAREYGMTDEQIAGELKTTTKKVAALAAHLISSE